MTNFKTGMVALAALGLAFSGPASAQTRSAAALPVMTQSAVSADCAAGAGETGRALNAGAASLDCGTGAAQMSELGGNGFFGSTAFLIALLAIIAAIILAASGGGNGNDSPG